MIHKLYKSYNPITATPFQCTEEYMEFVPCDALKPYIRCFWGSKKAVAQEKNSVGKMGIVIPDTCMVIIFTVDFTNNKIFSSFCGIDDRTFVIRNDSKEKKTFLVFVIRFFPWGAALFSEESLRDTKNAFFDADSHFPALRKAIEQYLFDVTEICQFIPAVEKILQSRLNEWRQNQTVIHTVARMLEKKGNISVAALEQDIFVGSRQLHLREKNFNMVEAAYRYEYSDQSHLCHDFKKYHSMNMADARRYAAQNAVWTDVKFGA